jgi:1-acyl-sn-glycerol-3-phosphate acyltransferase
LPDANVVPFPPAGQSGDATAGPSKAARLVGNTGPQPRAPKPSASRVAVPAQADADPPALDGVSDGVPDDVIAALQAELAEIEPREGWIEFIRRRMSGDYSVDEFGFDPELTERVLLALMRPIYHTWFRVEASGLDNVPSESSALVVANHSGTIAFDAVMTQVALHDEHPAHRHLRMLGANLVFQTPFMGDVARKMGHTLACHPDAERLLSQGEVVGVWPEGFKGIGKPFSQRYKLQRFGRGGFVAAALRTRSPIVPTAIVGAEEIYPMVANAGILARIFGLPYFPITPTFPWLGPLGMVPLPSKWLIHFGEPIPTDHFPDGAADDPMIVFNLTDQVREQIQQSLYRLLVKRPSAFG